MVARDGRVVWVSEKAAVVKDELSGTLYWQGVMVDITDRKRAEEALAASERQYRSVFDAATIGLMTVDLAGRVLEANAVVEQVLAHPPGSLIGASFTIDLQAGEETQQHIEALAVGSEERFELEHRIRAHDGSRIWCRTVMTLVRDGAGRPEHLTAMVENIDGRKRAEAELVHRTIHDELTRLPNRQHFLERLAEARAGATAPNLDVGVVFVDLDNFKLVNDSLGHEAGNDLLAAVAARLRAAVRPTDVVARFGGDEFLVLADRLNDPRDATQLAWRLANSLRAPFSIAGTEVSVTASFGVATSRDPRDADEDLVRKADAAMYTAKQRGSNRVAVFGELEDNGTALSA
jgi:diguanylate cyclase (GGDEF)-like protein/PAS domain S-box-containing protein